jgi:hypothetical protein
MNANIVEIPRWRKTGLLFVGIGVFAQEQKQQVPHDDF